MPHNIFEILFLIGELAYLFLLFGPSRRKDRSEPVVVQRQVLLNEFLNFIGFLGMQVIPLVYLLTPWLAFADVNLPAVIAWVGMLVFIFSNLLLWKSHADLGRNWSGDLEIKQHHTLVTWGVYRYIRHPIYAALWLWGIAQALMLHNWIVGLAGLAGFLPNYLWRVPREEQMLLERFGDVFTSYKNSTGRVFPRLNRSR